MTKVTGQSSAAAETQDEDKTPAEADKSVKTGEESDEAAPTPKKGKEAEGDEPEGDEADEGEADETQGDKDEASEAARKLAKRRRTMQDRLDTVTGKFHDANRRATRAERELAKLKERMEKGYDQDPNPDVSYSLDKRKAEDLASERDSAEEDKTEARKEIWRERASVFEETHDDFKKVAYSAPIEDETSELISDMEDGPAVAYFLGKNHAEARRIDRLPASQKAFALGALAERLKTKPLQRITQAPAPIKNGVSGNKSGGAQPKFEKLSPSEYAAIVAAEEKAKRK